ncbi:hypothetical protein ACFFQW_41850 [Umezawaea endophytica]|uniref:Uncharacterized protein n=1 Tax=Umezawaea endophytica TaxID=1654476 RepID=A0A9X2VPQ5_9PSEU|nr:hypothetical protein [Umezawaea endophytica]MCS7480334.1 hypothetical protein [Umezawaea endophytica]
MRRMYDSVSAGAIPTDAEMVAGYVDGRFAWSSADWARFPNSVRVRISAIGATHVAEVFDVEVGCIWPPRNVVPLVVAARNAGIDPTVYVNQHNDWGPTRAEFDRAGVPHPHWWVAHYDGVVAVPDGAVAKQYAHPGAVPGKPAGPWETGQHYDLSAVLDYWPGVDNSNGDDVSFNDQITNHEGVTFSAGQWLTWSNEYAAQSAANTAALLAKLDALAAVVTADKDVSAEELRRIVDDAVKANSSTQAKMIAQQAVAELRVAVREELGEENQEKADAIVDAVAVRLARD